MFWEICGYEDSNSKDKEHFIDICLKNPNVIDDESLNFSYCFHEFMDYQNPDIMQTIQRLNIPFKLAVEYRDPLWWKRQLVNILNWKAYKSHFNSSNGDEVFDNSLLDITDLKDRSLIIELLFRFSRTEPEFKENIIAMLNHLREIQKEFLPVYYDSKKRCYNQDAIENQKKVRNLDKGFFIPAIYQNLYPFNTEEFIKKYNEQKYFCRHNIECRLFQESGDVYYIDDKNRIKKNYRETNKKAMYTRYLYLDRNNYVHNSTSRTINELLKPEKLQDLLFTLADFLLYLESDSNRYKDDKIKSAIANDKFFSTQNEICTESIRKECITLAGILMKIKGFETDEISCSTIENYASELKQNETVDYTSEISKNEFLRERLNRLLSIVFLTYEPDFNSPSIDFLIEHKMQVLLYITSVTLNLAKEIN